MDHLLAQLRSNDLGDTRVTIGFSALRNDHQVAQVAEALHENEFVDTIDFDFFDYDIGGGELPVNWTPLLREIETREKLPNVSVYKHPSMRLLPLFRDQLFQAFQRNRHVHSLKLQFILFSTDNIPGIVSFLGGAQSLTDLDVCWCSARSPEDARYIAEALQRNNRLQRLSISSPDGWFYGAVFQHLASIHSISKLEKLIYDTANGVSAAEALQQYLERGGATIDSFAMRNGHLSRQNGYPNIIRGLIQNTSVTEVAFHDCVIYAETEETREEYAQLLASLVRGKASLRFSLCNFFRYQTFSDAVADALVQRGSSLRRFDFDINYSTAMSLPVFQALMPAICRSTTLEHLHIGNISGGYYQALEEHVSLLKVKDFSISFRQEINGEEEDGLVEALSRNYLVLSVKCKRFGEENGDWLSAANQNRLEFYLDRNRKLAQWVSNPKLVPCELWSYAITLALKAGMNSLYQSLIAASGEGIGLRERGKTRKRPPS